MSGNKVFNYFKLWLEFFGKTLLKKVSMSLLFIYIAVFFSYILYFSESISIISFGSHESMGFNLHRLMFLYGIYILVGLVIYTIHDILLILIEKDYLILLGLKDCSFSEYILRISISFFLFLFLTVSFLLSLIFFFSDLEFDLLSTFLPLGIWSFSIVSLVIATLVVTKNTAATYYYVFFLLILVPDIYTTLRLLIGESESTTLILSIILNPILSVKEVFNSTFFFITGSTVSFISILVSFIFSIFLIAISIKVFSKRGFLN
tara:strand:+ start:2123 stop:2908 length:786 start_codon:yes stop_codon:yes gene_type:complete